MTPKKASAARDDQAQPRRARNAERPPVFPYTTRPGALRKFLADVPRRPRPAKVNRDLIASWGIKNNEAATGIQRVLRDLGLIGASNEPTDHYVAFMHANTGPGALGQRIREVYAPLFGASISPDKDSQEALQNLFNIHSGGAPATIELQIQTFKALTDYADLSAGGGATGNQSRVGDPVAKSSGKASVAQNQDAPAVHIDLHIHLPENKTSRDYQYIIQDIARFIYRQPHSANDSERE